jgi:hypothetical protein
MPADSSLRAGESAKPPSRVEPDAPELHRGKGSRLVTPNYVVTIFHNCPEGCVSCDKLIYHGVSRRTGKEIILRGSTWHSTGVDGTPSTFWGYRFENGDVTYIVRAHGTLTVVKGRSKVLLSEEGIWQD